jgi:hypothetical protein
MADRIAFFTYGVLKQPIGHPEVQGFIDRIESVYGAAEGSLGFFARSERNVQTWEHSWGPVLAPQCTPQGVTLNELAMALSLWRDLESVAAFAYRGAHGEALSKRKEWFRSGEWPTYVAWWVNENHKPNWKEAADRIDHLHQNGPTSFAFTFQKPFDSAGASVKLNRERSTA